MPVKTRGHKAKPVGPKAKEKFGSGEKYSYFTPRKDGAWKATTGPNKGKNVARRDHKKDKDRKAKTVSSPGYDYRGDRHTRKKKKR
jgi:hypothetical protein